MYSEVSSADFPTAGSHAPYFCSPYLCLHPLTLSDQIRLGKTYYKGAYFHQGWSSRAPKFWRWTYLCLHPLAHNDQIWCGEWGWVLYGSATPQQTARPQLSPFLGSPLLRPCTLWLQHGIVMHMKRGVDLGVCHAPIPESGPKHTSTFLLRPMLTPFYVQRPKS